MSEADLYRVLLISFYVLAAVTFPMLFFVTAPYGRYTRKSWGPTMSRRLGWILMEAPSPIGMVVCFVVGERHDAVAMTFLALWLVHYVHRAFIFPFRMRGEQKRTTSGAVGLAVIFNLMNSYLNGRYLFHFAPAYDASWLLDPRFLLGVALFLGGLAINLHSDTLLIRLRRPGETGYQIPRGGLFSLVSCPNYLGEMVEWLGWALATWSSPGLAFAVWTAANLAPRAYTHHLWYRRQFPDYPAERRALIPFVV